MRAILQRVGYGKVTVENQVVASIEKGLVILLGVGPDDTIAKAEELAEKSARLRIFEDDAGKMNLSLLDVGGEAIVVSQFTLYADTSRGRRPSFVYVAKPELAEPLVDVFAAKLRNLGVKTEQGVFGAHMLVELRNDGPVTILLES
ncbi:MAG: D-tyrosyl-tRNA(Tyr) deacylase [Chloroflexi bacterium]|nr:D-tyrosyl-tRNA(Tyr) deacylase [Chloroflexota bacterium]